MKLWKEELSKDHEVKGGFECKKCFFQQDFIFSVPVEAESEECAIEESDEVKHNEGTSQSALAATLAASTVTQQVIFFFLAAILTIVSCFVRTF